MWAHRAVAAPSWTSRWPVYGQGTKGGLLTYQSIICQQGCNRRTSRY